MAIIENYKRPALELGLNIKPKFVLFDFDGVVVESFTPAFEVRKMMCPSITEEGYKRSFDGNINDWLTTKNTFEHDDACRHDVDFATEYLPRLRAQVKLVPEIDDVIQKLAQSYKLIIISSTETAPIQELLERYGLSKYFTEVMGNDVHKSKIEKMNMVFSKYRTDNSKCIFITDTLGDMREALHTKVATVGVTWGFHTRENFAEGKPFRIVEKPQEILTAVSDYFSAN